MKETQKIIKALAGATYNIAALGAVILAAGAFTGALVVQQEIWGLAIMCVLLAGASYHLLAKEAEKPVPCKECKYSGTVLDLDKKEVTYCDCDIVRKTVREDHFCSYGERKDEGNVKD